jgi:Lysine methyltransferase/Ankyrin repeats (3 copies)/Ankyrin repeats (many copies)
MPSHSSSMEVSLDEYNDILEQVSLLNEEDACLELLDAARFGEADVVRAILSTFPSILSCTDEGGSTALHKACANGHIATAKILIQEGANFTKNLSGNSPLHWAASNGHNDIVTLLLQSYPHIDVLDRNNFGRSALTEGFGSKSTETAKVLLEHDSASEEKLLLGTNTSNTDELQSESGKLMRNDSVIHEFKFDSKSSEICKIRELPITDDPFGDSPIADTTGFGIWCASLVMARWMVKIAPSLFQKSVIELGAGCGVPGLALAKHVSIASLHLTDLNPRTVENLEFNIHLNHLGSLAQASTIDWDDESTWMLPVEVIIGSDLIYSKSIVPLLKKSVLGLLQPGGSFYYVAPSSGRDGLTDFLQEIEDYGLSLESKETAPHEFYMNPLLSKDDEECFVHFTELNSSTYILYHFRKAA